jgi:hypothetical protein
MVLTPRCGHRPTQVRKRPNVFRCYRAHASVQKEANVEPWGGVARYVPDAIRIRVPLVEGQAPRLTQGIYLGVANPGVQPERLLHPSVLQPEELQCARGAQPEQGPTADFRGLDYPRVAENLGEASEPQGVCIKWRGVLSPGCVEAVLAFRVTLGVERVAAPLQALGVDSEFAQHQRRVRRSRTGRGRRIKPRTRLGTPRRRLGYAKTLPTRPPRAPPAPDRAPLGRIGTSGKGEPHPRRPTPRP